MARDRDNPADAALEQAVEQFARPFDLLRELVQNAVDAGTARIEVRVDFERGGDERGVLCLSIRDWGEGMDEAAIDGHLTRLYASSKHGDLTAIGRFGTGFASVFAMAPDAVLVRTGRDTEGWELLFHADRSFEKVRVDGPVDGTLVCVYKRTSTSQVDRFVDGCRTALGFWCEHCRVPITFVGPDEPDEPLPTDPSDPFAPYATSTPRGRAPINRPFGLEHAVLQARHRESGIEVVVGYAEQARQAFHNRGLRLPSGDPSDALGRYAELLGHLSFLVDHDRLEHLPERDRIRRDASWEQAMQAVLRARETLQDVLVERLDADVAEGRDPGLLHGFLALECRAPDGLRLRARIARKRLFLDALGRPLTLESIEEQEQRLGAVIVAEGPDPLCRALAERGIRVILDRPATRALLDACEEALHLAPLRQPRRIVSARDRWVLVDPLEEEDVPAPERALLERTMARLRAACPPGPALTTAPLLTLGEFGGCEIAAHEPLAVAAPRNGRVARRDPSAINLLGFRRRPLVVNRHHPTFRAQCLAADEDPALASLALAQALLDLDPTVSERTRHRLFRQALEEVGALT